jgi:diguanylate cyclase (GGDEF)-like protein
VVQGPALFVSAGAALLGVSAVAVALLRPGQALPSAGLSLVAAAVVAILASRAWHIRLAERVRRAESVHLATIGALSSAIEAKDPFSRGRARRVQAYALELARSLGVSRKEIDAIRSAALLLDIGKLAIPDYLLQKPGRLSDLEYRKVKTHTTVAADLLAGVEFPYPVVPVIRHHHERWDGSGYPDGLAGGDIPQGARILAVADAFEALTSDRAHRGRKSSQEACDLIQIWSGVQFDPAVAGALRDGLSAVVAAGQGAEAAAGAPSLGIVAEDAGGFGAAIWLERDASGGVVGRRASVMSDVSSAHHEVYALYEIAQTLGSSLRLGEILELVVGKIGQLVPYRTCVIYLLEDAGDMLSARFVSGANAEVLKGRAVRLGEGITGWAAAKGSNRFSTSPDLDLADTSIEASEYSTVGAFPLLQDGRALGVITLYFAKGVPCLDEHIRTMDIIAKLSAAAVHNNAVPGEDQTSRLTDELTGLPGERYLRQVFGRETIRSQQAGQPMAFLEMDLDHFKTINERHGHHVGDLYLAEVSRVLRTHLRERDVLVRLSADEFAAILPLTGFAKAALLSERLQQAVDIFSLRLGENTVARSGLSVGIALYPQDGESFEDLMARADLNMQENKAARKTARLELSPNIIPFPVRSPGQSR